MYKSTISKKLPNWKLNFVVQGHILSFPFVLKSLHLNDVYETDFTALRSDWTRRRSEYWVTFFAPSTSVSEQRTEVVVFPTDGSSDRFNDSCINSCTYRYNSGPCRKIADCQWVNWHLDLMFPSLFSFASFLLLFCFSSVCFMLWRHFVSLCFSSVSVYENIWCSWRYLTQSFGI